MPETSRPDADGPAVAGKRRERALRSVIAAFELAFPGRIRGFYLLGSGADGSAVATSDLDVTVLLKESMSEEERTQAVRLATRHAEESEVEMDIEVTSEADLTGGLTPSFKLGSVLVQGEDVRDLFPLLPVDAWARERMHAGYYLAVKALSRPLPVTIPFDYPDPEGEFFGYDARPVRREDSSRAPGTRNLIRVAGWMATARLAREAGVVVPRKKDCHLLYRRHIGDEWSDLLEQIYYRCRGAWGYLVPSGREERHELHAICTRVLAFENDYLLRYRSFLLEELRREEIDPLVLRVMREVPLDDAEVRSAIEARGGV